VGPSGGGKSTIADLVPRFYDPTPEGKVTLDGVDLESHRNQFSDLKQMGIVTQESILFNDSVFNNIAFGIEGISQRRKSSKRPRLPMPMNLSSIWKMATRLLLVSEVPKLSGGQSQRLSIASVRY
jgi:ATP-binding cassette, subfamily B, bacterial MsbA